MGARMTYQSLPIALQRMLGKIRWVIETYGRSVYDAANAALGPGWDLRPPREVVFAEAAAIGAGDLVYDQTPLLQLWENAAPVSYVSSRSQDVLYRLSVSVWEILDGQSVELTERRAKASVQVVCELLALHLPDNPTSLVGPCGIWRADISDASLGTSRRFAGDRSAIAHRAGMLIGLRTSRPWGNTLMPLASLPVPWPETEQSARLQDAGLFVVDDGDELPLGLLLAGRVTQIVAALVSADVVVVRFASSPQYHMPADGSVAVMVAQASQGVATGLVADGAVSLPLAPLISGLYLGDVTLTVVDSSNAVTLAYRIAFTSPPAP
jgi:hypothetical protein